MEDFCQNLSAQACAEKFSQFFSDPSFSVAMGAFAVFALVGVILGAIFALSAYIYFALALTSIAKKANYDKYWLAWIPLVNMFLFPILTGKKWYWGFLFLVPAVGTVFLAICVWKLLEAQGYDGKWGLVMLGSFLKPLSPFVSIFFLIVLGVLAWRKK